MVYQLASVALNSLNGLERRPPAWVLRKETGHPWTESVLARAEQERRLALLAREAIAQYVRVS